MNYRLEIPHNGFSEMDVTPKVLVTFRGYKHDPDNRQGPQAILDVFKRRKALLGGRQIVLLEAADASLGARRVYERYYDRQGLLEGIINPDLINYEFDQYKNDPSVSFKIEAHQPSVLRSILLAKQRHTQYGEVSTRLYSDWDFDGSVEYFIRGTQEMNGISRAREHDLFADVKKMVWSLKKDGGLILIPFGSLHFPLLMALADEFTGKPFVKFECILSVDDPETVQMELDSRAKKEISRVSYTRQWAQNHIIALMKLDYKKRGQLAQFRKSYEDIEQFVVDETREFSIEELYAKIREKQP